jgi:hypothetical protein
MTTDAARTLRARWYRDGMMIHDPGAGPNSYLPFLITRGRIGFA